MKKLLVLILCVGLMSAASAQKFGFRGGFYAPRVSVGIGYGFYPYWGFGYPYFGYPYYGYPYSCLLYTSEGRNGHLLCKMDEM